MASVMRISSDKGRLAGILLESLGWLTMNQEEKEKKIDRIPSRHSREAYHRRFHAATTTDIRFLRELDALLNLENYNDFVLQPTPYAYDNARRYLENVNRTVFPEFTPDGEGGIDIEWEHQGRHLALSCRARDIERDFISWREATGQYEGEPASQFLLNEKLDWLTR